MMMDLDGKASVGDADSDSGGSVTQAMDTICMDKDQVSNLFKAVHHFSQNDRLELVEVHIKNSNLMAYLSSLGHLVQEVNTFVMNQGSSLARSINDKGIIIDTVTNPNPNQVECASHSPVGTSCAAAPNSINVIPSVHAECSHDIYNDPVTIVDGVRLG